MLKKQVLRNNEYYDLQPELDNLYHQSKENATFSNLLPLITDSRNIKLAYRNIKRNAGSATAGVDKKTIVNWSNSQTAGYIQYVRDRLNDYHPQNVKRVEIPKDNGGVRPLGIPTIGDRLIHQQDCVGVRRLDRCQNILQSRNGLPQVGYLCRHPFCG